MTTPVILVTGVDPGAMASTLVVLSWDLPRAVVLRNEIDPERQVLTRTVSDAHGILEREEIELEHACVGCAVREDVAPVIERLARTGRWESIVACLPVGMEAEQVANAITWDARLQRHLRTTAVVAALSGDGTVDDLLGDDLLTERGLHSGPDDRRGVAEVGCALAEYADVLVLTGRPDAIAIELVGALAHPDADVVVGSENLNATLLVAGVHDQHRTNAWAAPVFDTPMPALESDRVWRLELSSAHPFHPDRLLADIERLGTGRHRSRGTFWLPTRPGQIQVWDGSGGQLSIGAGGVWGRRVPQTHLLITGVGTEPARLRDAFVHLLVAPEEAPLAHSRLRVAQDGFEPWLGAIRDSA